MTTPAFFALPALGPFFRQGVAVPTMAEGQLTDFVQPAKWPGWADRYRVQMQFRGFGRALLRSRLSNAEVSLQRMYEHAGASHVPTMLLCGKEDKTVPIAAADSVRKAMPQVEYHSV